jgi:hypothetical protein
MDKATGQIFRSVSFSANITKTRFVIGKISDNLEICSTARPRPSIQKRAETGEVCDLNVSREKPIPWETRTRGS